MPYHAPVYDYRWGSGTKMVTERSILTSSRKFLIVTEERLKLTTFLKLVTMGFMGVYYKSSADNESSIITR